MGGWLGGWLVGCVALEESKLRITSAKVEVKVEADLDVKNMFYVQLICVLFSF